MANKHDITDQLSNEADKIYICPLFDSHNHVKLDGATWSTTSGHTHSS